MRCQLNLILFILLSLSYISLQKDVINLKYFQTYFLKSELQSATVKTYETANEHICTALATRKHKDLKLTCHVDGKCMLSSKELVPKRYEPDSENEYVKCFTTFTENDCETSDGPVLTNGKENKEKCFSTKCQKGILKLPPTTPEATTECPIGYTKYKDLGCVRLFKEKKTWCNARLECLKQNADLASIDVVDNMDSVNQFCTNQGLNEDAWIGLESDEGKFKYLIGGSTVEVSSTIWRNGEPNCKDNTCWSCGRITDTGQKLADMECDDNAKVNFFICEVPIKQ